MVDDRKAAAIKAMTTAKEEKPNLSKLIAKFRDARDEMPVLTARDRAIMTNAGVTPPKSRMTQEQAMKIFADLKAAMAPLGAGLRKSRRRMEPATPLTPMGKKGGGMMKGKKKKAKKTKRAGRLAKRGYGAAKK